MENLFRILATLGSTFRQKLNSERFLRRYGRNILIIEALLVMIATLTFVIQFFLPAHLVGVSFPAWLVAFSLAVLFHQYMFSKIGNREICPYEILRQVRIRSFFFWAVVSGVLTFLILLYIWGSILAGKILSDLSSGFFVQVFLQIALVMYVVGVFFMVVLPLGLSAYFLSLVSLQNNRRARLTFRTVLVGLALIRKEKRSAERNKLVKKYVKWFQNGLRSYNKYLYEINPARLQIMGTVVYYRNLCSVASIGNPDEETIVLEQLRSALGSIKGKFVEDNPRRFLVALNNIRNIKQKTDYPSVELYKMIRPKSYTEKIKDYLSHPVSKALLGLVPIIAAVISMLSSFHVI
jgi:hypothetical protein